MDQHVTPTAQEPANFFAGDLPRLQHRFR
jgi:hypothetical protein